MSVESIKETRQYLSFQLDEEEFALDISKVREVLDMTHITQMPCTPDYVRGIINLRGAVVPVVDLHRKFLIKDADQTVNTRIIIGEVDFASGPILLGVLADAVHEVMELDPGHIEPAPSIGTEFNTDYLKGLGRRGENFVMILDIDRVFAKDEFALGAQSDMGMA